MFSFRAMFGPRRRAVKSSFSVVATVKVLVIVPTWPLRRGVVTYRASVRIGGEPLESPLLDVDSRVVLSPLAVTADMA